MLAYLQSEHGVPVPIMSDLVLNVYIIWWNKWNLNGTKPQQVKQHLWKN